MDIWGALALLFIGAFFATLLVAVFYWQAVRPRLMALARLSAPPPQEVSPTNRLQASIAALSESLVRHSALVSRLPTSFEVRGPAVESVSDALAAIQESQAAVIAAQADQGRMIADLERKINTSLNLWSETLGGTLGMSQAGQEGIQTALQEGHAALITTQADLGRMIADLERRINTSLNLWSETLGGTLGVSQAGQEGIQTALEQQAAEMGRLRDALAAAQTGQDHVLAAIEQQTADLIGVQNALAADLSARLASARQIVRGDPDETVRGLSAGDGSLQARLDALHGQMADQGKAIEELSALAAAFNAAQLDDIARLAALDERTARMEEQTLIPREVAPAPGGEPAREPRPARQDGLHRLSRQIAAQAERTLALGADMSAALAALSRAEARLAHHEDALAALRQLLDHTLQGQQTQAGLLSELSRREPPVQTVIREEKIVIQDRMQDIKGIGPVFSGQLHEHGIHSFRQLAELTPDELRTLVPTPRWRAINAESWIEQARLLASQKDKTEGAL